MIPTDQFPQYFQNYVWTKKHRLYGYPTDKYPDFLWISHLEDRFLRLRQVEDAGKHGAIYLLKDMIQWGGSTNGILEKFEDGVESVNVRQCLSNTISSLGDTEKAFRSATAFKGLGLTYASKLLRFLKPEKYGALDKRIQEYLKDHVPDVELPSNLTDTKNALTAFIRYTKFLAEIKQELSARNIPRPDCGLPSANEPFARPGEWHPAHIEMAIFQLAKEKKDEEKANKRRARVARSEDSGLTRSQEREVRKLATSTIASVSNRQ